MKKILAVALVVVILGSITAFAVGPNENGVGLGNGNGFGPNQFNFSEALMEEFGITEEQYEEALANDQKLKDLVDEEEFYQVMLEQHELRLTEMVEAGRITQEQAQEALGALEADFSDGTCSGVGMNIGENYGQRNLGEGNGTGLGQQNGTKANGQAGAGQKAGGLGGNGLRDGSCIAE